MFNYKGERREGGGEKRGGFSLGDQAKSGWTLRGGETRNIIKDL